MHQGNKIEDFIGSYYIDSKICDDIINFYNSVPNRFKQPGAAYKGVKKQIDKSVKESIDLYVKPGLYFSPFLEYEEKLQECLEKYIDTYKSLNEYNRFNINSNYNVQWYPPGGGFKVWHTERGSIKNSTRVLVFMTYLNDVKDGGTEFSYYGVKTEAKKGLTLIWPTDFTHEHRGVVSHTEEKYIVTGWYNFIDDQSNK